MPRQCDVAIIGGGVIGSAIAYFLAAEPSFAGSIAVIERDPTYRVASSALSVSSIRQQFSTPANTLMSRFGITFLRDIARHLEVEGRQPDIGLREPGYLFLATAGGQAALRANHRQQTALGADIAVMTAAELSRRFPWLATRDLAAGALGLAGEGWFDGYALLRAFRDKARSLGVAYHAGEVAGIARQGRRITGLRLADGSEWGCGAAVNAAGPWAGNVATMAGLSLPVEPRKRCVFVFACREELPDCPLVIDPTGVYFRPEGRHFIAGTTPPPERDIPGAELSVDYALFDDIIWPVLAHRVPAFSAIKLRSAWAGYYEVNTFDHNAVIGAHPALDNFYLAAGFSGHGMQHAPAAGRAIAELIAQGAFRTLDLSALSASRLVENRPIREAKVV